MATPNRTGHHDKREEGVAAPVRCSPPSCRATSSSTKLKKLKISITAPEAMSTIWPGLGLFFIGGSRLQDGG